MSFDATPSPYFLLAMRRQSWSVTGALAELVDNSFGSGRGNADFCHITYEQRPRTGRSALIAGPDATLSILDNGAGMESIGRLFRLGDTIGRSPGDIGLYGSGGTMALLWLAESATVYSLRDGKVAHDTVVWQDCIDADRFPRIDDAWRPATVANTPPALYDEGHGTLIVLEIARERGHFNLSNIRRDLGRMYGPGIRAGKRIIWTTLGKNGGTEDLTDQVILPTDENKVVYIDVTFEYDDQLLPVTGQIGLVDDLPVSASGIAIGYGARVIGERTKDCFVSPDRSERFAGASVTGWLDLGEGWQPYLSTTKSSINDRPLWDTLMGYVFEHIRDLLVESEDEKLKLELDEIALALRDLFDGAAIVTVPRKRIEVPDIEPTDEHGEEPADKTQPDIDDDPDAPRIDRPGRCEINIFTLDDHEIERVLCKAETIGTDSVAVYVNRDHPVIQTAMQHRPVNRMCLNMIVVDEIANIMSDDTELLRVAFAKRRKLVEDLVELDAVRRKRQLIRVFADNVRTGKAS